MNTVLVVISSLLPYSGGLFIFICYLPKPQIGGGEKGRAEPNAEQEKKKKVKAAELTIIFQRLREALQF